MTTKTDESPHQAAAEKQAVDPKTSKKLDEDSRFQFGPAPIQTPQDALQAFLREEITEDEFRAACGKFGVLPGTLYVETTVPAERPDAAYNVKLPDDMVAAAAKPFDDLETRQKAVEEKQKVRDEAVKKAEGETKEETTVREYREQQARDRGEEVKK